MKRHLAYLIPLAVVSLAFATATPSLSGTWSLNTDKSDPPDTGRGGSLQGPFGGAALFTDNPPGRARITQTDAELVIEGAGGGGRIVYRLDGRETKNVGPRGEMISTTRWRKDSLVTRIRQSVLTPRGRTTVEFIETRRLGPGGNTLLLDVSVRGPRGSRTRKFVFDRVN